MADGEVRIETKLDTNGVDKGLKELKTKMDGAGKNLDAGTKKTNNLSGALKGMKTTALATAAGVAGVSVAVKKTVDALNDCAAAYRVQENAEKALQIAAKNNPYLNEESVYNLKNFASALQDVSEVGDEVSIKIMSQLAATGRTEEQIMSIMSAAADMAAATGQDIGSAAQQLNATLNGNAGALGRQIGTINNLTKAELENGKAIELVAQQYKGMAAATANVEVQLNNAWGDFKENIGRGWQNVTQPVKQFFLDILKDINEAESKTRALKEATDAQKAGKTNAQQTKILLDQAQITLAEMEKKAARAKELINATNKEIKASEEFTVFSTWDNSGNAIEEFKKNQQQVIAGYEIELKKVKDLENKYINLASAEKAAADNAAERAQNQKAITDALERDKAATEYINANKKALEEQIKVMEIKADLTGKEIDAGEMYNAYLQSYIDLITKSNGLVTENNQAAKERLSTLQQLAKAAQEAATEEERLAAAQKAQAEAQKLLEEIKGDTGNTYFDNYIKRNEELARLTEELKQNEILSEQEKADAMLAIDEAYAQNKKNLWENITSEIADYTKQATDIAKQFGDLMLKNVQTERDKELAAIELKYEKGEMSEEEYYEKEKQIKRKAAQEEYKIQMFQWTASILTATANIAEGISKAIAQGGTAGLITGALVGAAGAIQIASIIASKPVPPQFAAGGIIGGANGVSMGSDNTYIHARNGEMVLNANQQKSLWGMINGGSSRSQQGGFNLIVNNTQAGRVDTNVRQQNDEILLDIVDKHVNKGFSDGTYDAGLAAMNTRQEGVKIL